jgi:hypothetical protein
MNNDQSNEDENTEDNEGNSPSWDGAGGGSEGAGVVSFSTVTAATGRAGRSSVSRAGRGSISRTGRGSVSRTRSWGSVSRTGRGSITSRTRGRSSITSRTRGSVTSRTRSLVSRTISRTVTWTWLDNCGLLYRRLLSRLFNWGLFDWRLLSRLFNWGLFNWRLLVDWWLVNDLYLLISWLISRRLVYDLLIDWRLISWSQDLYLLINNTRWALLDRRH